MTEVRYQFVRSGDDPAIDAFKAVIGACDNAIALLKTHGIVPGSAPAPLASVTGQIGFDAYGGAGPNPWKTYNGGDMPRWPALDETPAGLVTRERWGIAARAEITAFLASHGLEVVPADAFANTPEYIATIAGSKGRAITTTGNRG